MRIEGQLHIEMRRRAGVLADVAIRSTRPLQAARIFEGRRPGEILQNVPMLFGICGTAQTQAARRAIDNAMSQQHGPGIDLGGDLLVTLETAREHLRRMFTEWPAFIGEQPLADAAAPLSMLLPRCRAALFENARAFGDGARLLLVDNAVYGLLESFDYVLEKHIYGIPASQWYRHEDSTELLAWANETRTIAARLVSSVHQSGWERLGDAPADFLPPLNDEQLESRLSAADSQVFIAAPDWDGRPCETTPLARQHRHPLLQSAMQCYGSGLMTRLLAQLVELASISNRLRELYEQLLAADNASTNDYDETASGTGIGQVEAARGRLVHRVEVDDGRVSSYQILAPTEWNFHPDGVAARGLLALTSGNDTLLRRQASMLISAVDPCVGYRLELH